MSGSTARLFTILGGGLAAAIVLDVLLRRQQSATSTGFILVCSFHTVPPPRFPRALTTFAVEPVAFYLLIAATVVYLFFVRRARTTSYARLFPWWRIASLIAGAGIAEVTVFGPLAAYDHTFLTIHMVQHFVLITITPPLVLIGAPMTLLLIAAGPRTRKRFIYPIVRSRLFVALSHPLVGLTLFAVLPLGWYLTPAFNASINREWAHDLGYGAFLLAGIHYWWPTIDANPTSWRLPHPVRVLYLLALVPFHALIGLIFYDPEHVLYPALSNVHRSWGPSPLLDQQFAGAFMLVVGEAIGLVALTVAAAKWAAYEDRCAHRADLARARPRAVS